MDNYNSPKAGEEDSGDYYLSSTGRRVQKSGPDTQPDLSFLHTSEFKKTERRMRWSETKQTIKTAIALGIIVGVCVFGLALISLLSEGGNNLIKAKAKKAEFWNSQE